VIRIPCPRCGSELLRLTPTEPADPVTCPRCGHRFEPEDESWVDPEDA